MQNLPQIIENAYQQRDSITPHQAPNEVREAVNEVISLLDKGELRVAQPHQGEWQVNTWIKEAILLFFRLQANQLMQDAHTHYFDKVPLKYAQSSAESLTAQRVRVVPPAHVRYGVYVGPNTILMPSYVNIGAYIDSGTMVDTWATVGSCAQIGKNVHLSGGVGIGGVLEPLQAKPTIIEDDCFIGARSEIVEGVIIGRGSVISMGVYIGQSTRIYDRATGNISYGYVPPGSVVVPGNLPSKDGKYSLYCAVIVKQVDEKTRAKTDINTLLRDYD
jgi:2,3,4,5-tetrahydropyridine-2-carboxylate N-succinyltransferase